jgi:hypothetical protein
VISKANNPPSTPVIDGPATGHKNTSYNFTALSIDLDEDTIQYIFDWGDGNTTTTEFLQNGTYANQTYSWTNYGEYIISVTAYDGETESASAEHIFWIDVVAFDDEIIGYLVDENSDDIFDFYENTETGEQTDVEIDNDTYLIDIDGNDTWDYTYNSDSGLSTYSQYVYQKYLNIFEEELAAPGFELISLLAMIALVIFIMRRKREH